MAALVLWALSGWTWWVVVPVVGGLVVVRLALGLFPREWRPWASRWATVALVGAVVLWLVTLVTTAALGVAVGAAGAAAGLQLRGRHPRLALRWAAVGVSAAVALGSGVAIWMDWRAQEARQEANERQAHEHQLAQMRPDTPSDAFVRLAEAIATGSPFWACFHATERGRTEFAAGAGVSTCEDAVRSLHERVETGRRGLYGGASLPPGAVVAVDEGQTVYVTACEMYVLDGFDHAAPPGPALGTLTLERDREHGFGYWMTGYTPCGQTPPGLPAPAEPEPPATLPTYPPAVATLLTAAVADRDTSVCRYFTDRGRRELAAVHGAAPTDPAAPEACAAAVERLADQVADAEAYAASRGATSSTTAAGVIEVDACTLTWSRWGAPAGTVAGPQLGHLTLTRPDMTKPGYVINGVRSC